MVFAAVEILTNTILQVLSKFLMMNLRVPYRPVTVIVKNTTENLVMETSADLNRKLLYSLDHHGSDEKQKWDYMHARVHNVFG